MMEALSVRALPASERPRERLARLGAEALADQELLACVLGRGSAGESVLVAVQRLLGRFGSLEAVGDASVEQLAAVRGIGPAKAVQLRAVAEIARRLMRPPRGEAAVAVDRAEAAAALLRPQLVDKRKEHFVALLLDARHRVIRLSPIAIGSLSATLVHPRELFREAILASAAAVIVAHNHPSGDPQPSAHDVDLTRRLVAAGAVVGIEVLDHLVIAREGTLSLRAAGLMSGTPGRRVRRQSSRSR